MPASWFSTLTYTVVWLAVMLAYSPVAAVQQAWQKYRSGERADLAPTAGFSAAAVQQAWQKYRSGERADLAPTAGFSAAAVQQAWQNYRSGERADLAPTAATCTTPNGRPGPRSRRRQLPGNRGHLLRLSTCATGSVSTECPPRATSSRPGFRTRRLRASSAIRAATPEPRRGRTVGRATRRARFPVRRARDRTLNAALEPRG